MPSVNGSANLQQLSGLNALGVQQLLAASSQNSLASTQGISNRQILPDFLVVVDVAQLHHHVPDMITLSRHFSLFVSCCCVAALQSLANLQGQAGLGSLSGNGASPSSADLNSAASGLNLAALANFNSQNLFNSLGNWILNLHFIWRKKKQLQPSTCIFICRH